MPREQRDNRNVLSEEDEKEEEGEADEKQEEIGAKDKCSNGGINAVSASFHPCVLFLARPPLRASSRPSAYIHNSPTSVYMIIMEAIITLVTGSGNLVKHRAENFLSPLLSSIQ